jgi:hypothetical protein
LLFLIEINGDREMPINKMASVVFAWLSAVLFGISFTLIMQEDFPIPFLPIFLGISGVCSLEWAIYLRAPLSLGRGILGMVTCILGSIVSIGLFYYLIMTPTPGLISVSNIIILLLILVELVGLFMYTKRSFRMLY